MEFMTLWDTKMNPYHLISSLYTGNIQAQNPKLRFKIPPKLLNFDRLNKETYLFDIKELI